MLEIQLHDTRHSIICPYCKGIEIINYGYRKNKKGIKHTKFCKKCKRKFTLGNKVHKERYPQFIIKASIIISNKLSIRLTAECLDMMFGFKPDHSSIVKWKEKRIRKLFRKRIKKFNLLNVE